MKVNIRETLERVVEVDSIEDAKRMYKNGAIVLDSEDYVDTEFTEFEE